MDLGIVPRKFASASASNLLVPFFSFPQVGWIKAGDQTVLTLHKRVITHNSRVRVTHDEHRTWTLKILQVQLHDAGCYMCQINTAKMQKQIGCISVLGEK